jgi:hypothetical protein
VRQCVNKGLVSGKSQIIDSTHIVADMAVNSLSGLVLMCRQNVLKTVAKQALKTAGKLGMKDSQFTKQDRFRRVQEGLEQEIQASRVLLDGVTVELKQGMLKVKSGFTPLALKPM